MHITPYRYISNYEVKPIKRENPKLSRDPKTDWNTIWKEAVERLPKKETPTSWNKIATKFDQWMEKDDYPKEMVSKIKVDDGDTVLDIGCGNGTITIPLAKKARSVTALDISAKMLDLLKDKAASENLSNIKCINKDIVDVEAEEIGHHDVVVASRSLNGITDIKREMEKINQIAGKYVFMTIWGKHNRAFESEIAHLLGREIYEHPDYTIVLNILHEMGINAHSEPLQSNTRNFYSDMEEALDRIQWRVGDLNKEEKNIVKEHLTKTLIKNPDGSLSYTRSNSKWVLIWWEK